MFPISMTSDMYSASASGVQTQESRPSSEPANREIPPCQIPVDYWVSLRDRSILVAERDDGHKVRLMDLRKALNSQELEKTVLKPELLQCFKEAHKHGLKRVAEKKKQADKPSFAAAMNIVQKMQGMQQFFPLFAGLGQEIMKLLSQKGRNLDFLDQPIPVEPLFQPFDENYQDKILSKIKRYFKSHDFSVRGGDVAISKVEAFVKETGIYLPRLTGLLPDLDWLRILRSAFNERAAGCGLDIDFNKTPFFLNFIRRDVADPVAAQSVFADHPCTGNLDHGPWSHCFNPLFGYELEVLDKDSWQRLIHDRLFATVFDRNLNVTPDMVMTWTAQGNDHESIGVVNYESVLDGRAPNSFQTLLVFGTLSKLLEQSLSSEHGVQECLALMKMKDAGNLPDNKARLKEKIREIRALEYAMIGLLETEGKIAAHALAKETGNPGLETFSDLLEKHPEVNWGSFTDHSVIKNMLQGMVRHYLQPGSGFTVYQQVCSEATYKLKQIHTMAEFVPNTGYVVYPAGSEPPQSCISP